MTGRSPAPNYTAPILRRRFHQLIMVLVAAGLLGCVAMVAGPALNDRTIASDPGRALATVTGVGTFRTTVVYRDEEGIYHSPSTGLLYPTGLGEGQRVWVTYAKADPELVKVENRAWTLSIIPALSVAGVVLIVGGLFWWLVTVLTRRGERRRVGS